MAEGAGGVPPPRARGSPLKGEVLRLKGELREAEEARAALEARCGELEGEREAVRTKLRNAVRKGKKIEGEKQALEAAAAVAAAAAAAAPGGGGGEAERRAREAEEALDEARTELERLRHRGGEGEGGEGGGDSGAGQGGGAEVRELQRELEVMRAAMRAAAERVAGTAEAEAAAKLEEEARKAELGELRKRGAELEGRLAAAEASEAQHEALAAELVTARRACAEQEGRASRAEEKVGDVQRELEAAEAEVGRMRAECARQTDLAARASVDVGAQLKERRDAIEAREQELVTALESARAQETQSRESVAAAESQVSRAEEEVARLSAEAAERNKRFKRLKVVFDEKEAGFAARIRELETGAAKAERRAAEAEGLAAEKDEAAAAAVARAAAAEASLRSSQATSERLAGESGQAQEARIAALEAALQASESEVGELGRTVAHLESAATQAASASARDEQEREGVQEQLRGALAREADAQSLADSLEQRCKLLQEQAQLREEQAGGGGDLEEGSDGPGPSAAAEELRSLRGRAAIFEKQEAQYQNRIAALESKNQELGWQVAMVAGGGAGGGAGPGAGGPARLPLAARPGGALEPKWGVRKGGMPGLMGAVLRYRFHILGCYLLLLHALVYFALTHGVFNRHA